MTESGRLENLELERDPDDWRQHTDVSARRRIQNRIAQRNRRKNLRNQSGDGGRHFQRIGQVLPSSQPDRSSDLEYSQSRNLESIANDLECTNPNGYGSIDSSISFTIPTATELPRQEFHDDEMYSFGDILDATNLGLTGTRCCGYFTSGYPGHERGAAMASELELPVSLHPLHNQSIAHQKISQNSKILENPLPPTSKPMSHARDHTLDYKTNAMLSSLKRSGLQASREWTPLHLATSRGSISIIKLLLTTGIDINCQDSYGRSVLFLAAANGSVAITRLLLCKGAIINLQDHKLQTPIHIVAQKGHFEILDLLLTYHPNIDAKDSSGRTALHIAIMEGNEDIVRLLLRHGADCTVNIGYDALEVVS